MTFLNGFCIHCRTYFPTASPKRTNVKLDTRTWRKLYQMPFHNPSQKTIRYEPRHDKTNKMSMRPAKTQISLGTRPVWSVFAVRMKKPWVLSYPLSAQRRLISLGGCPGWSESSLGAQSFYWFCHVAAHIISAVSCMVIDLADFSIRVFKRLQYIPKAEMYTFISFNLNLNAISVHIGHIAISFNHSPSDSDVP